MAVNELVGNTGFEIKKFGELDVASQKVVIWSMAIDGEAWERLGSVEDQDLCDLAGLRQAVEQEIALYVAEYDETKFGVAFIPAERMRAALLEEFGGGISGAGSGRMSGVERLPGILSQSDEEVLQDGLERICDYLDAGDSHVPVVFAPSESHLEQWRLMTTPAVGAWIDVIERNEVAAARRMLDDESNTELALDDGGSTALILAAKAGRQELCALLLDAGAAVNAEGADGYTPLLAAVESGDVATVRLLITAGADVIAAEDGGLWSAAMVTDQTDMVQVIIEAGAEIEGLDATGESPLHIAARRGHVEVCSLLLASGADANASTLTSGAPLDAAVSAGSVEICELLIQHGADVRQCNPHAQRPSAKGPAEPDNSKHEAALEALEAMRLAGPHYVIADAKSRYLTPFQHAVCRGDVDYVRKLLAMDSDLDTDAKTMGGVSLAELANGDAAMLELLLSRHSERLVGRSVDAAQNESVTGERRRVARHTLNPM